MVFGTVAFSLYKTLTSRRRFESCHADWVPDTPLDGPLREIVTRCQGKLWEWVNWGQLSKSLGTPLRALLGNRSGLS
jgi:hypothetical protein